MLQGLSWAGYLVPRVALIATIFEYCNDSQIVQYHTRNMSDYLFKGIFRNFSSLLGFHTQSYNNGLSRTEGILELLKPVPPFSSQ